MQILFALRNGQKEKGCSTIWENCSHWDELLEQRAEMSGRLVLSEYTKEALKAYQT